MNAIYWQRGETIDYTNAGENTIDAGSIVSLATRIGVAGTNIAAGATGTLHIIGVFILAKNTGEVMTAGQHVYYDESEDEITGVAAGNIPAGWVIEAAASDAEEVKVCIADIDTDNNPAAANVAAVSAADAEAAGGSAPTKAEYDVAVALANANKAAINAVIAALKAGGLMATS